MIQTFRRAVPNLAASAYIDEPAQVTGNRVTLGRSVMLRYVELGKWFKEEPS